MSGGELVPQFYGTARSEERNLRKLVEEFGRVSTVAERKQLLDKIILRWSGAEDAKVSDYWRGSYFAYTSPDKLAVVEAFGGRQYYAGSSYRHPGQAAGKEINLSYSGIREYVYGQLMVQSHYKDLFASVKLKIDDEEVTDTTALTDEQLGKVVFDFSALNTALQNNPQLDKNDVMQVMATFTLGGYDSFNENHMRLLIYSVSETAPSLTYAFIYHLEYVLLGGATSDGNDRFAGEYRGIDSNSEDVFRTTDSGADALYGNRKGDVYQLGYGTGQDIIVENERGINRAAEGVDTIKIMPGLTPESVQIVRQGNHLKITLVNEQGVSTGDSFLVRNYFVDESAKVEQVVFEDGTVWDNEFLDKVPLGTGHGTYLDDYFKPLAANGESMHGGQGNDVYRLGLTSGRAIIDEDVRNHGGSDGDAIRLDGDLDLTNIKLSRSGLGGLVITLLDDQGNDVSSFTIRNFYLYESARVERLEDAEGNLLLDLRVASEDTKWSNGDISGVLTGNRNGNAFAADGGNDVLQGKAGNDVYHFGIGSGHDVIDESFLNSVQGDSQDRIVLGQGVSKTDVSVSRSGWDLVISLQNGEASLTVKNYYSLIGAKVEKIFFADGVLYKSSETLDLLQDANAPSYLTATTPIRGGSRGESLYGRDDTNDIFDSDAGGNDNLRGGAGADEYRLGLDTGLDTIQEGYRRSGAGDAGDLIRIDAGLSQSDIRLDRDQHHVWVKVLGEADAQGVRSVVSSLAIENYYVNDVSKVERIIFTDGSEWGGKFLVGNTESDILSGSSADETYYGGGGADRYEFSNDFGRDIVAGDSGLGKAVFTAHSSQDLRFTQEGNDLIISISGSNDKARFMSWLEPQSSQKIIAGGRSLEVAKIIEAMSRIQQSGADTSASISIATDQWVPIVAT